jgi:hypothetical protein
MDVYIRHINDEEVVPCGEMDPDQVHGFAQDIKQRGIHDSNYVFFKPVDVALQYVYSEDAFWAELIWWSTDEA